MRISFHHTFNPFNNLRIMAFPRCWKQSWIPFAVLEFQPFQDFDVSRFSSCLKDFWIQRNLFSINHSILSIWPFLAAWAKVWSMWISLSHPESSKNFKFWRFKRQLLQTYQYHIESATCVATSIVPNLRIYWLQPLFHHQIRWYIHYLETIQ